MPEASVLRYLDHKRIDKAIRTRREWGERMMKTQGSWALSWRRVQILEHHVIDLHAMCDFLLEDSRDRKIMISGDVVHLYTCDASLVKDVISLSYVKNASHKQIQVVGQPNTIQLKKPRHAWRSYFRQRQMTVEHKDNLVKFLTVQENVRLSPSMKWFLTSDHQTRMYDYYFVDHDDSGLITMLSLIVPGIIRRTLPITADK